MCGIYGIVGDVGPAKLTLARALCVQNQDRGHHSAGIATVGPQLETTIYKRAIQPTRFARQARFAQLAKADYRVLIGHTRFPTHGLVTDANAHPFRHGATVGVHNGIVSNIDGMGRYLGKVAKRFEVDSQLLVECLDRHGTIGPAQGSINLAYFGAKDSADLRLIRSGNPLHLAIVKGPDGESLVFSSDHKDLRFSLATAGLKAKIYEFPDDQAAAVYIQSGKIDVQCSDIPRLPDDQAAPFRRTITTSFMGREDYRDNRKAKRVSEMTDQEWYDWCAGIDTDRAEYRSQHFDYLDVIERDNEPRRKGGR